MRIKKYKSPDRSAQCGGGIATSKTIKVKKSTSGRAKHELQQHSDGGNLAVFGVHLSKLQTMVHKGGVKAWEG